MVLIMVGERWRSSDALSSGSVDAPKVSVPLTSTERFPCGYMVGGDLGERLLAQRFPGFC